MKIKYNVNRKELVKAISEILGTESQYLGAPTMAYRIGNVAVDRDCVVETDSTELIVALKDRGFAGEVDLSFSFPLEAVNVDVFKNLLESKKSLIQKALGITDTPVVVTDGVYFPWFDRSLDGDELRAYSHFISAFCHLSRTLKRSTAKEKEVPNEKYAFRCFLLRLGFIGDGFKQDRKILLRNFTGSSAFKGGAEA